jgi:hypothetical protein
MWKNTILWHNPNSSNSAQAARKGKLCAVFAFHALSENARQRKGAIMVACCGGG